jgi:prepilin-type N-terminal cleavage/methylation domain-containing protein
MRITNKRFLHKNRGFTLIELLVVIAIIGLLSSVVLASLSVARAKARDAQRLSDLRELRTALELYASDHKGAYPSTGGWWGNCSSYGGHGTSGSNGWIPNLAPAYIPALPVDPHPAGTAYCYLYNGNGTNYMILAYNTVETYSQSTNTEPRPKYDGNPTTCPPTDTNYQKDFAVYTEGGKCW